MNHPKPSDIFPREQAVPTDSLSVPEIVDAQEVQGTSVHELGNPELPIAAYREQIVNAVEASQATVITAETGAGKSTQVPQFLAEAGYEVVVTQPRIVAARTLAGRVRDEVTAKKGESYADFVGYRTARERDDKHDPQILYVTDGLQQVRELSGAGVGKRQVLVPDEAHEWNLNMEVLIAYSKKRMKEDPDFKVVIMSATLDAEPLARYFEQDNETYTPIIEVPGRTYDVKKEEGGDVADQAIRFAKEGKNTLVFVPGKGEISATIAEIERAKIEGATVLPLHGQLDAAEQKKVFKHYDGVKVIVSTDVAQTSITIDDIDAVVDSGLARRNEVKNGVEGLYLRPVSKADCLQRAGRAGRTKKGEYVLAQLDNNPFVPMDDREEYGTPEILRTQLDGMVLRLAKNGFDADEFDFFHNKDNEGRDIKPEIAAAKKRLQKLGGLNEDGTITKIGRQMERMPVESHYARMMIEARQYGAEVQTQLAAMLATEEVGGVIFNGRDSQQRWRELVGIVGQSDMLVQLQVFLGAQKLSDKQKRDRDIIVKNYKRANETYRQLRHAENLKDIDLSNPNTEQREQLVRCIISGMVDNLYTQEYGRGYVGANGQQRELGNRSTISGGAMVVGKPFDLSITTRRGPMTLHLIESATQVPSVEVLRDVAPQLFSTRHEEYQVDDNGVVVSKAQTIFNDQPMQSYVVEASQPSAGRHAWLIDEVYRNTPALRETVGELRALQQRTTEELPVFSEVHAKQLLAHAVSDTDRMADAMQQVPELSLFDIVPVDVVQQILDNSPDDFAGQPVEYQAGVPVIRMQPETITAWDSPTALPDGRELHVSYNWRTQPLAELMQSIRVAEQQRLEEQRLAEERQRAEADKRAREAEERLQAKQLDQQQREQAETIANTLLDDLNNIKSHGVPAEWYDDVERLWDTCISILNSNGYGSYRMARATEAQRDFDSIRAKIDAHEEEFRTSAVTADSLAALAAKYSNH